MTCLAMDDGIPGQVAQGGAGAVIDQAIAEKARLGIEVAWLQLRVVDKVAAGRAHDVAWMSS
jgi:hypothetical protein